MTFSEQDAVNRLLELARRAADCTHQPLHSMQICVDRASRSDPRGRQMHIAGRRSPKGDILCLNYRQQWVVLVDAYEMLAWCVAKLKSFGITVDIKTHETPDPTAPD